MDDELEVYESRIVVQQWNRKGCSSLLAGNGQFVVVKRATLSGIKGRKDTTKVNWSITKRRKFQ